MLYEVSFIYTLYIIYMCVHACVYVTETLAV